MAGSAGGVRAGKAFVEIGAKDDLLRSALASAQKRLEGFGRAVVKVGAGIAALGTAALAPMLAMAHSFAEAGSELNDMSVRTGASVEALSALKFAAEQTGAEMTDVETAIKKTQRAISEAAEGSKSATDNLARLGLTAAQLQGLSPEKQFEAIADALNRIPDPTQRAAAAMAIFGKSGTRLLPMVAEMRELTEQARRLGLVMTTQDAQAADALGDAIDTLHAQAGALKNQIGAALAPVLTELARTVQTIAAGFIFWVRENRALVVSIAKLAVVAIGVGSAIMVAGAGFILMGKAIGALLITFVAFKAILAGVAATLAFIVSPLGLTLAAVAALGGAIVYYSGAAGAAIEWLKDRFGELSQFVGDVVGGIRDALIAGDVQLAGEILWTGLQIAWTKGIGTLKSMWIGFKASFLTAFTEMATGATVVWQNLMDYMARSTADSEARSAKMIETIANLFARVWNDFSGVMQGLSEEEIAARKAAINEMSEQEIKAIDNAHSEKMAANEAAHIDALRNINEEADARIKAIKEAAGADTEQLEKQLADLRAKLAEKIEEAKKERDAARKAPAGMPKMREFEAAGLATSAATVKSEAVGAFGGRGLQLVLGDKDSTTKEIKESNRHLKRIADNTEVGLTFA